MTIEQCAEFLKTSDQYMVFSHVRPDGDTLGSCAALVHALRRIGKTAYMFPNDEVTETYLPFVEDYFAPADYTENSELDKLVKAIIVRTATNEILEEKHFACKKEQVEAMLCEDNDAQMRMGLIISLDGSKNFKTTHTIMKELSRVERWSQNEIEMLLDIALKNHPVRYILNDPDVKSFYQKLIGMMEAKTEKVMQVKETLDKE